jgi:hypothetical protein
VTRFEEVHLAQQCGCVWGPELPEVLDQLRSQGIIRTDEEAKYRENYNYFQDHRTEIVQNHRFSWVASLNKHLIIDQTYRELMAKLVYDPDRKYAYFERVV